MDREHGIPLDMSEMVFRDWVHTCNGVHGVVHDWPGKQVDNQRSFPWMSGLMP
jgi:hypothetical protein